MNFKNFIACAKMLPVNMSVMGCGEHGVGKSMVVYQLAEHFGLPVVERRLSQMTEGDMIGLPVIKDASTAFMPPDWYLDCCRNPRVLFLDEINRATPEVMQAAFEIVLDRRMQGQMLHPETRVYAMVNTNSKYNVNAMDPAFKDRFWMTDMEPTVEDWLDWARGPGKIHYAITDFIQSNEKWLDTQGKEVDNDRVHPSRRSWEKLSQTLEKNKMFDNVDNELFWLLCTGFIGVEASTQFRDFVKNMDKQLSATDILDNYDKIKKKIARLGQERMNVCIEKIAEHAAKESLTDAQLPNLRKFVLDLPGELRIALWSKVISGGANKLDNAKKVHKAIGKDILAVFGQGGDKIPGTEAR